MIARPSLAIRKDTGLGCGCTEVEYCGGWVQLHWEWDGVGFLLLQFSLVEMIKGVLRACRFSNIRDRIKLERQTRLAKGIDAKTLTTKSQDDLSKIRNIGIIAHIDAGKTTTTERMLYYAGALPSPGNIDDGTTAMDFLVQERERGITIRSAAISFNWLGHQINLIDTPGHVDFSGEVTRSLRVLDGVVTILDAVKGVESQTQKVWAQATKQKIPKLCFLNKMDRIGSSAPQSIESLKNRLGIEPLVLQMPIGDGDSFRGIIDLVDLEEITFSGKYGQEVKKIKLSKNTQRHTMAMKVREKLVESIANYNDEVADMYLKEQFVPSTKIKTAIRKIITSDNAEKVTPVLLGASFKNLGVQPLLDAVVSYLPSPSDRGPVHAVDNEELKRMPSRKDPFLGYVFKVMFDIEKGPLAYTRVYSGHITKNFELYNTSKKLTQKAAQVLRVRANHYVPINEISAGDIIALSGFRETHAGDTLTAGGGDEFLLQNLDIPSPVFTAPFELESSKHKRQFDQAMVRSVTEDTSLSFEYETETNQYLVSGLGQLHLEILKDRLKSEGIPVKMGSLKINFKQTINVTISDNLQIKKELKPTVFEQFCLSIALSPLRTQDGKIEKKNEIIFTFEKVPQFDQAWYEFSRKKQLAKNPNERSNFSKEELSKLRKNVRNPTPNQPMDAEEEGDQNEQHYEELQEENEQELQEDEEGEEGEQEQEQPYYHMNTLPFETLHELVQTCKTSLLYGKNRLPATGIRLQITNGKYKRSSFSKSVMNRCASTLVRKLLDSSTVLIQPIMQFTIEGDADMIQIVIKDVLKKRGRIDEQSDKRLTGIIPAEGVRGWISQLRAMGVQIDLKFRDYQEVMGINPERLVQGNY